MKRLLLALMCFPLWAWAEGGLPTGLPYLYVTGSAEVRMPADNVTVRFEISSLNLKQELAGKEVQQRAAKAFALLDADGIAHDDVVAGNINSEKEFEKDKDGDDKPGNFLGYRVKREFAATVRDLAKYPPLIAELLKMNVDRLTGLEEGLSKQKELEDQSWNAALADARARAEKIVKAAGMKISYVYAISSIPIPEIEQRMLQPERESMAVLAPRGEIKPDEYRLAPITITQGVHVIYVIEPAK